MEMDEAFWLMSRYILGLNFSVQRKIFLLLILDKHGFYSNLMKQPRGRASRYLYVLTQTKRFDPDIILYILFLDSLRNFLFDFHYHFF